MTVRSGWGSAGSREWSAARLQALHRTRGSWVEPASAGNLGGCSVRHLPARTRERPPCTELESPPASLSCCRSRCSPRRSAHSAPGRGSARSAPGGSSPWRRSSGSAPGGPRARAARAHPRPARASARRPTGPGLSCAGRPTGTSARRCSRSRELRSRAPSPSAPAGRQQRWLILIDRPVRYCLRTRPRQSRASNSAKPAPSSVAMSNRSRGGCSSAATWQRSTTLHPPAAVQRHAKARRILHESSAPSSRR